LPLFFGWRSAVRSAGTTRSAIPHKTRLSSSHEWVACHRTAGIERGTKPEAAGWKPCDWAHTWKGALAHCTERYTTPWGQALNFDGPYSDEVRRLCIENALAWVRDFHIDALTTFVQARLEHTRRHTEPHRTLYAFYTALLCLRTTLPALA
jgi:hypothetical protein